MKEVDEKFVNQVAQALYLVRDANIKKTAGTIMFGDDIERTVEASVVITRDAIRSNTGRQKVRGVVVEEMEVGFQNIHGLEVTRTADDNLLVKTVPMHRESEFASLENLLGGAKRAKEYIAKFENDDE